MCSAHVLSSIELRQPGTVTDLRSCHAANCCSHTESLRRSNAIFEYIEVFHNRRRRQSALGMRTPIEFELMNNTTTPVAA